MHDLARRLLLVRASSAIRFTRPVPLINPARIPPPPSFSRAHHQAASIFRRLLPTSVRASLPREPVRNSRLFSAHHLRLAKMASNGETTRRKRKESPVERDERPAKMLKPELSNILNGDDASGSENGYVMASEDEDQTLLPAVTATADTAEWQATIEQVVKNVVSIHFCQTCSFDTDPAMSSEATGFVVDAKQGYILTNRHVVGAGPFWGYCIFDNHEEVS